MRIVLVGAGNLATNIGKALHNAGHDIVQVYSRTMLSASLLASCLGSRATDDTEDVIIDADVYVVSVKDSALPSVAGQLARKKLSGVVLHTAGSVSMAALCGMASGYGVLYPMQTFSRDKEVDFKVIPCFIEASDDRAYNIIRCMAESISDKVGDLSSEKRKYLHLAAVFACNFVNHCYALSSEILAKHGIPFDVMLPLTDEAARKIHVLSPAEAQTGPAVRYDENVINMQKALLADCPQMQEIYDIMSRSIHLRSL